MVIWKGNTCKMVIWKGNTCKKKEQMKHLEKKENYKYRGMIEMEI